MPLKKTKKMLLLFLAIGYPLPELQGYDIVKITSGIINSNSAQAAMISRF